MPIAKIHAAYVRHYEDNGQTTAYVEWTDTRGTQGRTQGNLHNIHMAALMRRAVREGVPVTKQVWGV